MDKKPIRVRLYKSNRKGKKYAVGFFQDDETEPFKMVHFGAVEMDDFTTHKNKERKERFLNRFKRLIDKEADNPYSPMTLSHLLLWNKPSLKASFNDYKRRFEFK
jgi:hypothetical protein